MKKLIYIQIFFAIVGLGISIYLTYLYAQPTPISCVTDCEEIRQSEYSRFYGISVPLLGVLYYLGILIASTSISFRIFTLKSKLLYSTSKMFLSVSTTLGFLFSIYLTFLEAFVLDAWCQWCIISAILSSLIFLTWLTVSFYEEKNPR